MLARKSRCAGDATATGGWGFALAFAAFAAGFVTAFAFALALGLAFVFASAIASICIAASGPWAIDDKRRAHVRRQSFQIRLLAARERAIGGVSNLVIRRPEIAVGDLEVLRVRALPRAQAHRTDAFTPEPIPAAI